jgi:hypothetical protein
LGAECFSWTLEVLYGGLGISKLQFLNEKIVKISAVIFFLQFVDPDRIGIQLKCWIRMNPGPKHCLEVTSKGTSKNTLLETKKAASGSGGVDLDPDPCQYVRIHNTILI